MYYKKLSRFRKQLTFRYSYGIINRQPKRRKRIMNGKYSRFFTNPDAFVTGVSLTNEGSQVNHPNDKTYFENEKEGIQISSQRLEEQAQALVENKDLVIGYSIQKNKVNFTGIVTGIVISAAAAAAIVAGPSTETFQTIAGGAVVVGGCTSLISGIATGLKSGHIRKKNDQIAAELTKEIGVYEVYSSKETRDMVSQELESDPSKNITHALANSTIDLIEKQKEFRDSNYVDSICNIFFIDQLAETNPEEAYRILATIYRYKNLYEPAEFNYDRYPENATVSNLGEDLSENYISTNKTLRRIKEETKQK